MRFLKTDLFNNCCEFKSDDVNKIKNNIKIMSIFTCLHKYRACSCFPGELDVITHVSPPDPVLSKKSTEKCKYGDRSFSLGQHLTIGPQSDIWCSCETPPLITCKSMLRSL